MKTFNIYKKRDGQDWKLAGEYFLESFEEAKKEFAKNCWNDLLNGKHGDNFTLFTESDKDEFEFVTGGGIYDGTELFFSKTDLEDGIERFREDVYIWEIRELFKFKITEEDGYTFEEEFESLDKAQDCFTKNDGYKVEQIN